MAESNWAAIAKADPDARSRYGFGSGRVHFHPRNNTQSLCGRKRCELSVNVLTLVTCERCKEKSDDA